MNSKGDFDEAIKPCDLSPCYRGYGVGVCEVRLAPGTIHSDLEVLNKTVPSDVEEMRFIQNKFIDENTPIRVMFMCVGVCGCGCECVTKKSGSLTHTITGDVPEPERPNHGEVCACDCVLCTRRGEQHVQDHGRRGRVPRRD